MTTVRLQAFERNWHNARIWGVSMRAICSDSIRECPTRHMERSVMIILGLWYWCHEDINRQCELDMNLKGYVIPGDADRGWCWRRSWKIISYLWAAQVTCSLSCPRGAWVRLPRTGTGLSPAPTLGNREQYFYSIYNSHQLVNQQRWIRCELETKPIQPSPCSKLRVTLGSKNLRM